MRIFVTGIGIVSPLGIGVETTFDGLVAGRCGLGPLTLFDASGCRSDVAAEVPGLSISDAATSSATDLEGWSRTDAMAVLAAREALAGARVHDELPVDLICGGTTAGMFETEALLAEMHGDREARRPLSKMLSHPLSATVDRMQEAVRPFGQARTICSACSSGANALLLAATWLRTGRSERVLAGGADGLCRLTYTGFSSLGALSPEPCRPFDRARRGLTLGEGAAFLLVETEAAAEARGAIPICELRGWAVAAEAHHITNPEPTGETAAAVMAAALRRAALPPDAIGYVNAHGTATPLNDRMESAALRRCFGDRVEQLPVSSSKGQIGHTLGAAGAIEAAVCALVVERGIMPPTVGLASVDPECALGHLQEARSGVVDAAMSDSFGFGGSDAVLVLTRPEAFAAPDRPSPCRVWVTGAGSVGPLGVHDEHADYVAPGAPAPDGASRFDAKAHLDLGRARRIDRAGRMATVAMQAALAPPPPRAFTGAIVGAAFGSVDHCSAFVHRVYDKGARFARPAAFPNLLPSSPVAHASIYHRFQGPVFSSADLGATAEGAIVTAAELIAGGEAEAMFAGGVEEASPITEAVLGPLCSSPQPEARGEGAVVLRLEAQAPLEGGVELSWSRGWRGAPVLDAPDPGSRARVFVARDDAAVEAALSGSAWAEVPRAATAARAGGHEAAGGFAAAAAFSLLREGAIDEALVLGLAPDRGYAFLLRVAP